MAESYEGPGWTRINTNKQYKNTWASKASAIFARCCAAATSVAGFRQWGHSGLPVAERISNHPLILDNLWESEKPRRTEEVDTAWHWCFPTRQTTWMVGPQKVFFSTLVWRMERTRKIHMSSHLVSKGTKHFRKRGSLVKLLDPAGACGLQCHSLVCISAH